MLPFVQHRRLFQDEKGCAAMARVKHAKIKMKRFLPIYLMMVPGFLYLIINNYIPMFGIIVCLQKIIIIIGDFREQMERTEEF